MADKARIEQLLKLIETTRNKKERMLYVAALRELLRLAGLGDEDGLH